MILFVVHNALGEILRSGSCPESMVSIQAAEGQFVIEGVADDTQHYVADGQIVEFPTKPSEFHAWDWVAHAWALKDTALIDAKAAQSTLLDEACRDAILTGFDSAALGTIHHYPAKAQDQANLVASVTASLIPSNPSDWMTPFWCEASGAWDYIPHTAAQIQQAGADGKAAILAALGRNEYLQRQIQAATSIDAVQAIVW